MNETPLLEISEEEYLQVEEALSQTARGRAFLRMRDRRTRNAAVDEFQRVALNLARQVDRLSRLGGTAPGARGAAAAEAPPVSDGALTRIQQELNAIGQFVQQARSDIAALKPSDNGTNRIMAATAELDAIVVATERATSDILNAAERILDYAARIPRDDPDWAELGGGLEAECIEIMTACSFQDITGQRTTKVVNTLRYIEQRVNSMIEIWGVDRAGLGLGGDDGVAAHRKLNDDRPDAHLLNGPQLEGQGVSQAEIDSIFDQMAECMPEVLEREPATEEAPPPPTPAAKPVPPPAAKPVPPPPAAKSVPPQGPAAAPAPRKAAQKAPPPAPVPAGGGEQFSQDDIDKLFA
ncbi:hypothetical protein [Azospirillum sp. ST 5-10]|uniref:hypothetical protein n=1 Tax=unclassified Azospirillum TaxID=2630922 RepID=UPI003F4A12E7